MNNKINYPLISCAREARGMTQKELASELKITQGNLSKIENGFLEISSDLLCNISSKLNYPTSLFYSSSNVYSVGINFYRKYKSLSVRTQTELDSLINIYRINIENLLSSIEITTNVKYCELEGGEFLTPEDVAVATRKYWGVPRGPIKNLTQLVEKAGIIVFFIDSNLKGFSGVSTRTESYPVHIIFVNKNMSSDRIRFTISHELGHIIMHSVPTSNSEEEANRFASEFLMPSNEIAHQLDFLTIQKLANLKLYWKASMASILFKAKDLGSISARKYSYMWTAMGKKGYRKEEPIEFSFPIEEPNLVFEITETYLNQLDYKIEEISTLCGLNKEEFIETFLPNPPSNLELV